MCKQLAVLLCLITMTQAVRCLDFAVTDMPQRASRGRAQIQPSIEVDQDEGPAPLAVVFDATGTAMEGVERAFHELEYLWDFDDADSGHGASSGPIAAHVFEEARPYRVTLTVLAGGEQVATKEVVIRPKQADRVFAGDDTICFSADGDFAGAPTGSRRIETASFDEAMKHYRSGRRLLFRRGQRFKAEQVHALVASGDSQIGAFGAGEEPDELGNFANNPVIEISIPKALLQLRGDGLRVTDLRFEGADSTAFDVTRRVERILLFRLASEGLRLPVVVNHFVPQHFKEAMHSSVVVANNVHRKFDNCGFFGGAEKLALVRNRFEDGVKTHLIRITFARKAVLDGNVALRPHKTRHALKLHAQQDVEQYGRFTEQVVIRGNEFAGDASWLVTVGPQNGSSDEALRDILIERNRMVATDGCIVHAYVNSADTTIRNNLFLSQGNAVWGLEAIAVTRRGVEPVPSGVAILNNTFSSSGGSSKREVFVKVSDHEGPVLVANNLMHAPDSEAILASGEVTESGNLVTDRPRFDERAGGGFGLASSSPAVGKGVPVPVFTDFDGVRRKRWDVGAFGRK